MASYQRTKKDSYDTSSTESNDRPQNKANLAENAVKELLKNKNTISAKDLDASRSRARSGNSRAAFISSSRFHFRFNGITALRSASFDPFSEMASFGRSDSCPKSATAARSPPSTPSSATPESLRPPPAAAPTSLSCRSSRRVRPCP